MKNIVFKDLTELADFITVLKRNYPQNSRIELEADIEQCLKEKEY